MRQADRHGNELANTRVEGAAAGRVEADFAFLCCARSASVSRTWSGRGRNSEDETNSYVKPLVVHFVEMKDRPVATRRDQALDDAQAVLCLGSVFEDAVLVFRATLVSTALEIVLEAYAH
jgi:hypothetical protein